MAVGILSAAATILLAVAVAVRGLEAEVPVAPEDDALQPAIPEPMQLLSAGAEARIDELTGYVDVDRLLAWEATHRAVFELEGCPALGTWLDSAHGQAIERLVASLQRGSREEALAALALVFGVARATRWRSGLWTGTASDAEHLGALLEGWLSRWAERSTGDPLLYEPALAAVLLYGRAMRMARNAPTFGTNEAAEDRSRRLLDSITGRARGRRTDFGTALQAAHPRAYGLLGRAEDPLAGLDEDCALSFPRLDGTCGQ